MAFPGERSRDNARGPGLTGDASTSRALGRRDSFVEAMSRKSTADHSQRIRYAGNRHVISFRKQLTITGMICTYAARRASVISDYRHKCLRVFV
jgi:hypothetical protein